jgi:hypothetical protein
MNTCFTCLNCGKQNQSKGNSFTNKYCNNKCQAEHRSRMLVSDWKDGHAKPWAKVPDWIKKYLIEHRGHKCQSCNGTKHNNKEIPLIVNYKDGNTYNNSEENLELICPNCRAQK